MKDNAWMKDWNSDLDCPKGLWIAMRRFADGLHLRTDDIEWLESVDASTIEPVMAERLSKWQASRAETRRERADEDAALRPKALMPVNTIGDFLSALDREITEIKTGVLDDKQAGIVVKNRNLQLQAFQLILKAASIESAYRGELNRRIGVPASADVK